MKTQSPRQQNQKIGANDSFIIKYNITVGNILFPMKNVHILDLPWSPLA